MKRLIQGTLVLGALLVGAWRLDLLPSLNLGVEADTADHLVGRVWIDRLPADDRDIIGHFVMVQTKDKVGATGRSSRWRHATEVFLWKLEDTALTLAFPQERVKAEMKVKTWKCRDAPEPFTLCARFSRGDRSATLYSREDWVVGSEGLPVDVDLPETITAPNLWAQTVDTAWLPADQALPEAP